MVLTIFAVIFLPITTVLIEAIVATPIKKTLGMTLTPKSTTLIITGFTK